MKPSTLVAVSLALLPASAGTADAQVLAEEKRVPSSQTAEIAFTLPEVPAGRQVRLALDARVDWPSLSGYNPWMRVAVNGKVLRGANLLNKPVDFTNRNGVDFVWEKGSLWTVLYAPTFTDEVVQRPMPWGFADCDPYRFVWDVTALAKAGENKVSVHHPQLLAQGTTLVLRDVTLEVGEPLPSLAGGAVAPAPPGPLPTHVARGRRPVAMDARLASGGALQVQVGGRTLLLSSRTSEPEGRWSGTGEGAWQSLAPGKPAEARWAGTGYTVSRRVTLRDDHLHVADTLQNKTDRIIGVLYENRLAIPGEPEVLLGGRPVFAADQTSETPAHPSAMARWPELQVGLFAEDDIFRLHVSAFVEKEAVGLADPRLGIGPGQAHTLEWSLYPAPGGDYWDVINAVRRNWGANYTIPGPALFDGPTDGGKSPAFFEEMVKPRALKMAFSGQTAFLGDEVVGGIDLAEGTAIPLAKRWCASATEWVRKIHAVDPGVKTFIYVHPSICTEPDAEKRYADCRILDPAGRHVTSPYRYPVYEYLAAPDTAYGKALLKTVEWILENIRPDGIYMDEIAGGSVPQYAYHTPWDGCTVEIDPKTHAVTGQCANAILRQQGFKEEMVRLLRRRGKMLVGNGPAVTRTMLGWKMPLFTELGSYSFLIEMHLSTPLALGNHDNDQDERVRARMTRRALDHAGVICGYSWTDRPAGLHYWSVMFPLTPAELRPGMILGEERIVTNRSGRYGWPDGAAATVYVFDGDGKHVPAFPVPEVREGGRRLYELRIPGDHLAVLVRQGG